MSADRKDERERESKWFPFLGAANESAAGGHGGLGGLGLGGGVGGGLGGNYLGHEAVPDLADVGAQLDSEFRWKDLFAKVQQRNETPALLVYRFLSGDRLLEAQMEHFLETYIRRHLSPTRQNELEAEICKQMAAMDEESINNIETMITYLPANTSERELRMFWKSTNVPRHIVRAIAKRCQIDPDQQSSSERLGLDIIRAVQARHKAIGDPALALPTGAPPPMIGIVGPTGTIGPTYYMDMARAVPRWSPADEKLLHHAAHAPHASAAVSSSSAAFSAAPSAASSSSSSSSSSSAETGGRPSDGSFGPASDATASVASSSSAAPSSAEPGGPPSDASVVGPASDAAADIPWLTVPGFTGWIGD